MARIPLLLVAVTLIAGFTPLAARMATTEIPPLLIPVVRFGTAGAMLALTARVLGLWKPTPRRHWPLLAALGLMCVPVNQLGYLVGIKKANASHAGIAYALVPVMVFWISITIGRASLSRRLGLASLLAFLGAVLVDLATGSANETVSGSAGSMMVGDGLLFSAALSWSLFVVLSQPLVRELGPVPTLCIVFLLGTLFHLPVAAADWLWFAGDFSISAVTWRGWNGLAYLTFITAHVNFLLWYIVTSRYDVTRSAVVTNSHFIVTVLLEAALFSLSIGWSAILGSALLMAGIILATQSSEQRQG